jgi:DNA-binding transcriptional regulator YiaG
MTSSEQKSRHKNPSAIQRKSQGRIESAKLLAMTDAEISAGDADAGIREDALGPAQVIVPGPDVRAIRARFDLSQEEFAERFGLGLRTLQEWEQRRRVPDSPARLLSRVIELDPDVVERAAHS